MVRKTIYFRADANHNIGYGHFVRSLALADMLNDEFDCCFVLQTPSEFQISQMVDVCRFIELPAGVDVLNSFLDMLTGDEVVVLDNYFYTVEYCREIKQKGSVLVCIDDFCDKHFVADLLINTGTDCIEKHCIEPYTRCALGLEWALLRRCFYDVKNIARANISETKRRALICFGGADPFDLSCKFVNNLLLRHKCVEYIDVIGGGGFNKECACDIDDRVCVHRNISANQVSELMIQSDFCIVSASGVAVEAIALGCDVYSGYYIDNQHSLYDYLTKKRYIHGLGDLSSGSTRFAFSNECLERPDLTGLKNRYISLFKEVTDV